MKTKLHRMITRFKKTAVVLIIMGVTTAHAQSPLEWAKAINDSPENNLWVYTMTTDASGNMYFAGTFAGAIDFDAGSGSGTLLGAGDFDAYFVKYNSSGNFVWAKRIGGVGAYMSISDIEVDGSGNIYLTGNIDPGECDFDPGSGTHIVDPYSNDFFIAKYNSSGNFIWVKDVGNESGGGGYAIPYDMEIDASGNIYLTGDVQSAMDFDPSFDNFLVSGGGLYPNTFIAKYSNAGDFTWAYSINEFDATVLAKSIKRDASGNLYIAGEFAGTVDFDPGSGTTELNSYSIMTAFIAKFNSSGVFQWVSSPQLDYDASPSTASSLSLDGSNVFITGQIEGPVDFDPGSGTMNISSVGVKDIFIAKYNSAGTVQWAKSVGGANDDVSFKCVSEGGNVYIMGNFQGTVDFDPGSGVYNLSSTDPGTLCFAKYDASGNMKWAANIYGYGASIDVDQSGSIYITGDFGGSGDFDPGWDTYPLQSSPNNHALFLAKYSQGTIGINELSETQYLDMYPNPVLNSVVFNFKEPTTTQTILTISNAFGQIITTERIPAGFTTYTINLAAYASGIYFVRTEIGEEVRLGKIIKQ